MATLVFIVNNFFDILWLLFLKSHIYVDFVVISAISALIFLWIFKKTSNQEMIRKYKGKIFGHILMIRLYKDKPGITLHSILSILGYNFLYLRYTLVSILMIAPLLVVISIQLNNRYGYAPLNKGDRFIIHVDLDESLVKDVTTIFQRVTCSTSKGIILETPALKVPSDASLFWRARLIDQVSDPQEIKITINNSGETIEKDIITSTNGKHRFSPTRSKWRLGALMIDNAEDFISKTSPFKSITVNYKRASYPFIWWHTDPIVLYFILTLILGLVLKPFIKVDF